MRADRTVPPRSAALALAGGALLLLAAGTCGPPPLTIALVDPHDDDFVCAATATLPVAVDFSAAVDPGQAVLSALLVENLDTAPVQTDVSARFAVGANGATASLAITPGRSFLSVHLDATGDGAAEAFDTSTFDFLQASPCVVEGGVSFADAGGAAADAWARARSTNYAGVQALQQQSLLAPVSFLDLVASPAFADGMPGIALLDHDGDGDLDVYVSNGPGAANSLLANQWVETGSLSFVDVAGAAGVTAAAQDSSGVCAGDIDNDGDPDLLVLGRNEPNRLFENQGGGAFSELVGSAVGGGNLASTSCAMGDFDADGLLDVVVANIADFATQAAFFLIPFATNQHNQLFLNQGGNVFADASAASGILQQLGFGPGVDGSPGLTWAVQALDVEQDGDTDVVFVDDQGGLASAKNGGQDRGYFHVYRNDGTGQFTDDPVVLNGESAGQWMGIDFGDLDCDGHLDFFGSNFGDYDVSVLFAPYVLGDLTSRWFLGSASGTFSDPGVGGLVATPFGWGTSIFDYDNDGDADILFHGSIDLNVSVAADNPGALLRNPGCSADFVAETNAFAVDHGVRGVRAVATGDLDRDGFVDVVSASSSDVPAAVPLAPVPQLHGSVFDATALFAPTFSFVVLPSAGWVWNGIETDLGSLVIERNSADNGNAGVTLRPRGGAGLVAGAVVNRDGIGATFTFRPNGGTAAIEPIAGGASHASQHALEAYFGLGLAPRGTLDVLWPGGVRNRLYDVAAGERLDVPEIPCSYDGVWADADAYATCVGSALDAWLATSAIDAAHAARLLESAIRAFQEG